MGGAFGERLLQRLKSKGLSVNKLALLADVNQSYLNKIALGQKEPSARTLEAIASHLGLDVASLRAWALEDELGEEQARRVARAVLKEEAPPLPDERSLRQDPPEAAPGA